VLYAKTKRQNAGQTRTDEVQTEYKRIQKESAVARNVSFLRNILPSSAVHPASCSMGRRILVLG
jgi:hypothetical protein